MILNIISNQYKIKKTRGPQKVLQNLLLGLDLLGVEYVFNQTIHKHQHTWIHDSPAAIIEAGFVGKPVIAGPNVVELPSDLPILRKKLPKDSIYLHPSSWPMKIWSYEGYNETQLKSWPVGIDTEKFVKINRAKKNKVLIYHKQRDKKLLEKAKEMVQEFNLEYSIIEYGKYSEEEYKKVLNESKFGIWIGCTESQGIALQEALATNLPLIVLDATTLFDNKIKPKKSRFKKNTFKKLTSLKTTSVPYFDKRCGIKIKKLSELKGAITQLQSNFDNYCPSDYILENLTLENSALQLLGFFEGMNIPNGSKLNFKNLSKTLYWIDLSMRRRSWGQLTKKLINRLKFSL